MTDDEAWERRQFEREWYDRERRNLLDALRSITLCRTEKFLENIVNYGRITTQIDRLDDRARASGII